MKPIKVSAIILVILLGFVAQSCLSTEYDDFEKGMALQYKAKQENSIWWENVINEKIRGEFESLIRLGEQARTYEKAEVMEQRLKKYIDDARSIHVQMKNTKPYDEQRRRAKLVLIEGYVGRAEKLKMAFNQVVANGHASTSQDSLLNDYGIVFNSHCVYGQDCSIGVNCKNGLFAVFSYYKNSGYLVKDEWTKSLDQAAKWACQ